MGTYRVQLPDGRIVNGVIQNNLLIVEGKSYTCVDAISAGLSIDPLIDPAIDEWVSTYNL